MSRRTTPGALSGVCLLTAAVVIAAGARTLVSVPDSSSLPVFTEITHQAGLNMRIINGADPTEYLTDVNGEGACFIDYNRDGYQDIFLVNGSSRGSARTD